MLAHTTAEANRLEERGQHADVRPQNDLPHQAGSHQRQNSRQKNSCAIDLKEPQLCVQDHRHEQGDRVLQDENRCVEHQVVAQRAVEHRRRECLAEVSKTHELRWLAYTAPLVQADSERLQRGKDDEDQVHRHPGQDEGDERVARGGSPGEGRRAHHVQPEHEPGDRRLGHRERDEQRREGEQGDSTQQVRLASHTCALG